MKNIKELWRELLVLVVAAILGAIIDVEANRFIVVHIVLGALGGVGFVFLLTLCIRIFQK